MEASETAASGIEKVKGRARRRLPFLAAPALLVALAATALVVFDLVGPGGGDSFAGAGTGTIPCSGPRGREGSSPFQSLAVPAAEDREYVSNDLKKGSSYEVWVFGVFIYDGGSGVSDGINMLVNGRPAAGKPLPNHEYCVPLDGAGVPVRVRLQDTVYADNRGVLNVEIWRVGG